MRFNNTDPGWGRAPIALGALALAGLIGACGATEHVGTRESGSTSMAVTKKSDVNDRTTTGAQPMTRARSQSTTPGEMIPSGRSTLSSGPSGFSSDGTTEVMSESMVVLPGPEEIKAAWQEGLDLFQGKDYEGAATKFAIVALGREEVVDVHYLLGLSLWNSGRHDDADTSMTRASSLDPDSPRIWTNLARIRLDRDDSAGALQAIEGALAIEPDSADALHQKGRALFGLNRGDEAIEILSSARSLEPENGYIANTLGWVLIQMDRSDEAVRHLEEARDALPKIAFVRNNLGVVYEGLGRTESAYEEYRAAVEAGDSEGKASISIVRIEPFVEQILAQSGETLPPPATVRSMVVTPAPVDSPDSGGEIVVRNIPEPQENGSGGTDEPDSDDSDTGDTSTGNESDSQ